MLINMYTMLSYIFIILVIFCIMHVFYYNDQKLIFDNYDNNYNNKNINNNINNINNFLKEKFNANIDLSYVEDMKLYQNDLQNLNSKLIAIINQNVFPLPTISPTQKAEILNQRESYLIQIKNLLTNLYTTRFSSSLNDLNAATYNAYNQYI
jgi:hypothetical protein